MEWMDVKGVQVIIDEHELCIFFACCFCEKKPPLLFCRLLHMHGENQVQEDKKNMRSTEFDWGHLGEALNTP